MTSTTRVPDNLDLALRAQLGLNGLLGTCDPELNYEAYFLTYYQVRPAYFLHWSTMVSGVMPKYIEALALLKCMTGSPDTEHEKGLVKVMMENADEDGFIYDRKDPKRPWNVGVGYGVKSWNEDYANIAGNGRWANAMWYMYQLTGDDEYKAAMKRCVDKLFDVAVFKNDYAYYPNSHCGNDFSWIKAGWPNTDEPKGPRDGAEGATTHYATQPVRGLMKWYQLTGDERMLDLSKRLIKFITQPKFYGGLTELDPDYGAERAHWYGHTHGNLAGFRGIADYACITGDVKALEFVRDGFEWLRHNICPQLGQHVAFEGCTTGDLPALAIQLSDAGIGDFWDDADYAIRNATAQVQVTDIDAIRRIGEFYAERPKDSKYGAPDDFRFTRGIALDPMPGLECVDNVLERSIGAISYLLINGRYQQPSQMACCTANALQGFYYAWEAAIRHNEGVSTVNLLFTRFSEWMDLISYLPYEGKVVIRNKTSKIVNVRIPGGVNLNDVQMTVNSNHSNPAFCGRYVNITNLNGDEEIVITFPQGKRKETLTIPNLNGRYYYTGFPKVNAEFIGTTCIGLEDEGENIWGSEIPWVKLFNEPKYHGSETIYKEAPYYVPNKIIKWY